MFYNKKHFKIEPKRHYRKVGKVLKVQRLRRSPIFQTIIVSEPQHKKRTPAAAGRTTKNMSDSYRRSKQRILD